MKPYVITRLEGADPEGTQTSDEASCSDDRMKLLQILVLLVSGGLVGTFVTSMWLRPHRPSVRATRPPSGANARATNATATPAKPSTAQPPSSAPLISAAPSPHTSRSPARTAVRKPPPFRRIQPAHIILAVGRPEPAVVPPPISSPPPASFPTPVAEPQRTAASPISPQLSAHQVTLYPGLLIPVRLVDGLSSERNQPGDTFTATIDHEIVVEGFVIVERGALVEGRVTAVDRGAARLTVELTRLYTADRQRVTVQTEGFERRTEPVPEREMGGLRNAPATLPVDTRIRFRLRTGILLTEKLG